MSFNPLTYCEYDVSGYQFWPWTRKELSRETGGRPHAKHLGPTLWKMSLASRPLHEDEAVGLQSVLFSMEEAETPFRGWDLRREYPLREGRGRTPIGVQVSAVGADNTTLRLRNLPSGFRFTVGDYLEITLPGGQRALHQAIEAVTVPGGATQTPLFRVTPYLRPGVVTGLPVNLRQSSTEFFIDHGSIGITSSAQGLWVITYSATEGW